jgi:Lar family restriction alleviation protein
MSETLKCPFCGGEAKIKCGEIVNRYNTAVYRHYHVECMSCGVDTRNFDTDDEAIEAWNRRTERTAKVDWINGEPFCPMCGDRLEWE